MANIVEFLVKVKDLASGPMGKIASSGSKSFSQVEQGISRVTARFSKLGMSINDIDRKLDQLRKSREISIDSRQIRRLTNEMDTLERRKARLEGGNSGSGFSGLTGLAAGAMAMAGVAGMGGVVSMGMERQMTNKRFEVMAGKEAGGQLSGNLASYAQNTVYGNEVFGAANTMLAFGINVKGVMPTLKALGDIAGGDKQRLESLSLAFSQVAAAGRLTGQDLLQFVNAGFNPLQEISAKTGKSMAVLKKEVEDGKISFSDVAGAIERATGKGGRFFEMTKQIGDSAPGKLLALQGSIQGLAAETGISMLGMMVPLIDFTQWLVDTPGMIAGLAAAIGTLTAGIAIYQVVTNRAAISQWFLNLAVMWPIAVIALLVGAIVALIMRYKGWGDAMKALWIVIKTWCSNVGLAFKDFFQEVGYKLELFVLKMKNGVQHIVGAIGNMMRAIKLASQGKFGEAKEALAAEIKTKGTAEIAALEKSRTSQGLKNLAEFKANLDTIKNTSILNKLTLRKAGKSKTAGDIGLMEGLGFGGAAAGALTPPGSASETNKGITGGGVRNLTINVSKFFDDLHFHSASTGEGMKDIEERFMEMFLRVVNSANAVS